MKFAELLDQAASSIGPYRRNIFKTLIMGLVTGSGPGRISSIFRRFTALFVGSTVTQKRLYNFINSTKLPWDSLWHFLGKSLGAFVTVKDRLLIALDDTSYGKTGSHIAGCTRLYDHAAKKNSSRWIFGHCRVVAGIMTFGHGRWMCLPFAQKLFKPLPEPVKDSKKLTHEQWLETKSGIGAHLVLRLVKLFQCRPLVVCDSWFGTKPLLDEVNKNSGFRCDLLSRLRVNSKLYALPEPVQPGKRGRLKKYGNELPTVKKLAENLKDTARTTMVHVYGKRRDCTFAETVCMSRALRQKVKIVFVYRKDSYIFPLITTDLTLPAEEMIEYYSARWKIESDFKELKHEIGALDSQCRNENAVENHFTLCCFAASLAWVYTLKSDNAPTRMHPTRKSNSFAFADVRRRIASEIEGNIFKGGCPESVIPAVKFICSSLFSMSA